MILRLCTLLVSTLSAISAYPQSSQGPSLTSELSFVPKCAQECLRESLTSTFPSECTEVDSALQCYCSSYDENGFTFGEAALRCFYMNCPTDEEEASTAYNACVGQANMVQQTMGSIPITRLPPSATSSSIRASSTSSSNTVAPSTLLWPVEPTAITTSFPKETPGAASDTPLGPSAAAVAAPHSSGPLSTSQIVGISVAGASALILAAGAIVLMTCIQQRRGRRAMEQAKLDCMEKQNEKRSPPGSSHGEGNSSLRPLILPSKILKDPRSGPGGVGVAPAPPRSRSTTPSPRRSVIGLAPVQTNLPRLQLNDQRPRSQWNNPDIPVEQIGLAISPESDIGTSPDSMRSTRTVSRLLPAKPSPQLARPTSTASGLTVFEEDRYSKSVRQSQLARPPLARLSAANALSEFPVPPTKMSPYADPAMVPRPLNHTMRQSYYQQPAPPPSFPVPPIPVSVARGPAAPTTPMPFTPAATKSAAGGPQPALSLNIPVRHSRIPPPPTPVENIPSQASSPTLPPKPSPVRVFAAPEYTSPATELPPETPTMASLVASPPTNSSKQGSRTSNDSTSTDGSEGYVPKYYATPRSTFGTGRLDKPSKSPRIIDIRRAGSTNTSTTMSRSTTQKSASGRDSMASCTTFETADMDEPTPPSDEEKTLSPVPESPISGLKYPKVPRASNQAVPRSPRSSQNSLQIETRPSLLTKRRGEDAALERLFVSPISSSIRSSNTHSRVGSDGTLQQQVTYSQVAVQPGPLSADMFGPLKSPMWAPRITPTRRGQDLFLSVS